MNKEFWTVATAILTRLRLVNSSALQSCVWKL